MRIGRTASGWLLPLLALSPWIFAEEPPKTREKQERQESTFNEMVEQARRDLKDATPSVRANAARDLSWYVDTMQNFRMGLEHMSPSQRKDTEAAQRQSGNDLFTTGKETVYTAEVAVLLKDESPEVREAAVFGLRFCGPTARGHIKDVAALLKDENPGVRAEAARTLEIFSEEERR